VRRVGGNQCTAHLVRAMLRLGREAGVRVRLRLGPNVRARAGVRARVRRGPAHPSGT